MDHHINALLDRVDSTRGQLDLNLNGRIAAHELTDDTSEKQLPEFDGRADAQQARGLALQLHDGLLGFGELLHDLATTFVVGLPYFGEPQLARRTVEQAHAQALFKLGNTAADR